VGLSAGRRRRTAGLRREEVALLASMSATYYTFLEQGRPVRPSAQVLDALASALRMSAAERRYLHVLAYGPGSSSEPASSASAPPERLDPAVADLVQRLEPFPTLVKGRRWDVLAANPAARKLFRDWLAGPPASATCCAGCSLRTRPGRSTWSGSRRPGPCSAASGCPPPGTRTTLMSAP
jgi:transcriptional regulator with XRE-family HTH domain